MDDRSAARRPNLELVKDTPPTVKPKTEEPRMNSGVTSAVKADGTGPLPLQTGTVLEGKYLVGRVLGSGAVGIVYEAKNVELDERVAIKCLRPEMLVDPGMVARFAREAKAAAAIKSEYVASVYDVGTTHDGAPYIVMEYLDGKDLGTLVAEGGTLSPRTAVEYALHVCEALAVAHAKGIVHRDIKPENLLLTERAGGMKIVKVLDFGISKTALTGSIFQNELPLVKTVNLMGTPLYMSPEQVRVSGSVDVRSDIWSLGMVIYEILSGHTAFNGASITEICASILESQPSPLEAHRSDLPSGLVDVIMRCLDKDVSKRYQNTAELALALMPFGPKRTRLNVERAVAVLQGSGHIDASFRMDSEMPPAGATSAFSLTPIPKAPSVPGNVAVPAVPASVNGFAEGFPSSAPALPGDGDVAYPEPKKKHFGLIAIGTAVLLVAGVSVLVMGRGSAKETAPAPTATHTTAEPATAAPAPSPVVTAATLPAAATTTAAPAPTAPAKPAWMTAPRPGAHAAKAVVSAAPAASAAAPVKTKPTGEPDLGY